MAYTIEQYLDDIQDWPEAADLEPNRDAEFEHDQWLREQDDLEDDD